ncbi:MAG: L-ectoine synthase [Lentisphaerae bacterium ADurb.Bin242]|nr:MAG: L-ectoine synthase [Lentisphaerae bacterium ADurb.Bin242]
MSASEKRYAVADFAEIVPVPCPCGMSRRAFLAESEGRASFHVVEIRKDARKHYHRSHMEIYYVLEGAGTLEADNETIPLSPGKSVLIKEFCRHRAVGNLKIVNVSIPSFDPEDEWFD